jgi:hypothetical protein
MRKILLPFLLVSIVAVSCKKETQDLSDINKGNGFYPTEIGKYIVYNYDSIVYDDLNHTSLPFTGQFRYYIADTFRDPAGRLSYSVNIQRRKNDTDPYTPSEVFSVTPTDNQVEVKKRNLTFIKMVFPVSDGKTWNGNAMINIADDDNKKEYDNAAWKYTYSNFDKEFDPGNNLFLHTVTVNEIDDKLNDPDVDTTAYAYRNYSQAIYAYGVGMIYSERIYWEFQPKVGSSGGSGYRKGYEVRLKAVDHN